MGLGYKKLVTIFQDILPSSLVWGASSKLYLGGSVIKHQALQTGAAETTLSLLSQEHILRCRAHVINRSHHRTQESHIWARKPSDYSHRCSQSRCTSLFMHDTCSPALMKTCSAFIHMHTLRHAHAHTPTLKPCTHSQFHNNPQAFHTSQDTSSHAICPWTHTEPTCTHLNTHRYLKLHILRLRAFLCISQPSFLC